MIFADIDGTLIHKVDGEGTRSAGPGRFISEKTISLINKIREEHTFILITGRRKSGYDDIADVIPHDYAIIEHGGLIMSDAYDAGWLSKIKDTIGEPGRYAAPLWDYADKLRSEGYEIDAKGRYASFRVYTKKVGPVLPKYTLIVLRSKLEEETRGTGMRVIVNESMLDIISAKAGKSNAIDYLQSGRFIAMGDNANDADMLEKAYYALCPGNALDEIKTIVSGHGYVSQHKGHKGTEDVLEHILKNDYV
ncbi:MAG: HAD family hydrolase [Candidatus Woesearchaeota archaeon]